MTFRPRFLPTLIVLILVSIGIAAGNWQTRRAEEKIALKARIESAARQSVLTIGDSPIDAGAHALRNVNARGIWVASATMFVDNRILNGTPGYHVLTPLKVGNTNILVNRGWVAAPRSRDKLPEVATPEGPLDVQGQARVPLDHAFALGQIASADARVWQQIQINEMSRQLKLPLAPIVIFQHSSHADGLTRAWDAPDYGIDKHRGYALQWYALAIVAVVFFFIMSFSKTRHDL